MRRFLILPVLILVVSCASMAAKTPAQRVFAAQSDYNALLSVAVAYESQPRCQEKVTLACSDPGVVAVVRKADTDAYTALKVAQDTVRTPGATDSTVNLVLTAAANAVANMRTVMVNHGLIK